MSLLAGILELDEQVFLSLNSFFPASSDTFWMAVTKTITWIPLYVVILARLIKTAPNHSTWLFRIALTIVGVLIWDQGAGLFKEWIATSNTGPQVRSVSPIMYFYDALIALL